MIKDNTVKDTNSSSITEVAIVRLPKESKISLSLIISFFAIAVSVWTACYNYHYNYSNAEAVAYKPYGLGIIRGIKDSGFPSDHLVLPINWENDGAKAAIVGNVRLIVRPKSSKSSNEIVVFKLGGEYSDISPNAFNHHEQFFHFLDSFLIPPHSKLSRNFVFHINNWWDKKTAEYNFRFYSRKVYDFSISYDVNYANCKNTNNFKFSYEMPDRVNELNSSKVFFDYFSF
jgi:hypothetical protein